MTEEVLRDYFDKHAGVYRRLANGCSSVPELLLKIDIYGRQWNQWDWALFFTNMLALYAWDSNIKQNETRLALGYDILDAIDNSDRLDKIVTNKKILLSIIYVTAYCKSFVIVRKSFNCQILAHVFKKWPKLWNMNWMWTKHFDKANKKFIKCHRLASLVKDKYPIGHKHSEHYFTGQTYFNDF